MGWAMTSAPVIHWFRRDLRLTDNSALNAALESGQPVIPIFVLDENILRSANAGLARVAFMLQGLQALDNSLQALGARLHILEGNPTAVIARLVNQCGASAVYANADYTPYATQRDQQLQHALRVPFYTYHDALVMPPSSVLTDGGKPYTVFTPFKKKWRALSQGIDLIPKPLAHGSFAQLETPPLSFDLTAWQVATIPLPSATEAAAQSRLEAFTNSAIYRYGEARNSLNAHPFQGEADTSQLSPYLRFGLLSPRDTIAAARDAYRQADREPARESVNGWVDELIWREFYMHIMAHFPHVASGSFKPIYDDLAWEDDPEGLLRWQDGETGYPVVDAAMRQLNATGWMPNRTRMIVASFLTKDLLIHWQEGERYFMQHLIDGDPAANNGGWQWSASTGTDAQPYFRIFNPFSQSERFDPTGAYLRAWIPEIAHLSATEIHAPHNAKHPPKAYPAPIVDHAFARNRTLAAFKAISTTSTESE
jgi:deoxyribodipyrimidine photo-lyase